MNLLIVDDEFFVVEGVARTLRYEELDLDEIFCAYSAKQAKEIFLKHPISVLITDVEMPKENGFELLEWMEKHHFSPVTLLLTGHKKFEYAYEAMQHRCFQYLVKPVQKSELLEALTEAIKKVQMDTAFKGWMENLAQDEKEALLTKNSDDDIVRKVKRIVRDHIQSKELTRSFIAGEVFLNEDYLSYIFHKKSGETLKLFIAREKIANVKRYLTTTDLSMESIAEKTGFSDALYMRKLFKKIEGITPSQYRKEKNI